MRKSVLTGIFACAVIFSLGTAKADAAPLQEVLENQVSEKSVVEILEDVTKQEVPAPEEAEEQETVHTVTDNESLSDIAKQYDVTWERIFYKNDRIKDPNIINAGLELVIPDEEEELEAREVPAPKQTARKAAYTKPVSSRKVSYSSAGNGYAAGYCTWYVKSVRTDLPNTLGNAYSWFARAQAMGLSTGYTPRVGAVAQKNNHVAYVRAVNGDGTITISDMNYRNLYEVTTRTISASGWRYIY